MLPASYLGFSFFVMLLSFYLLSLSFVFLSFFSGCRCTLCQGSDTYLFSCQYKCRCFDRNTSFYAYDATNAYHASSYYPCPVESFFSPLSILPQAPSSMPVPPLMSSALSAGRLYRSQAFVRELGSTNPEWNLTHSYPFQSLTFAVFSQAMNVSFFFFLTPLLLSFILKTITPLHAMYTVACETTFRLQALENENFSLANQVSHLSSVNERLLSELQICQQLYLTEGFQRYQYMCGKI